MEETEKKILLEFAIALSGGCRKCSDFIHPPRGREKFVTVSNLRTHMIAKHNYKRPILRPFVKRPKRKSWWQRLLDWVRRRRAKDG